MTFVCIIYGFGSSYKLFVLGVIETKTYTKTFLFSITNQFYFLAPYVTLSSKNVSFFFSYNVVQWTIISLVLIYTRAGWLFYEKS